MEMNPVLRTDASQTTSGTAAKLKQAAEDFEGLILGQMLQSVRESALSGWKDEPDQAGAIAIEMAESQLAKVMASQGGLGIAQTLRSNLHHQKEPVESKL
jgi:Rod binding domain-containing protein